MNSLNVFKLKKSSFQRTSNISHSWGAVTSKPPSYITAVVVRRPFYYGLRQTAVVLKLVVTNVGHGGLWGYISTLLIFHSSYEGNEGYEYN